MGGGPARIVLVPSCRLCPCLASQHAMDLEEAASKRVHAISSGGGAGSPAAGDDHPDRLSALPDCLLHTILSSLKARQAVQTCVLSTRWRHLWRSVPCLDVDLDEFKSSDIDTSSYHDNTDKDWDGFEDFAAMVMFRCDMALLDSFRAQAAPYPGQGAGVWPEASRGVAPSRNEIQLQP
ncbi:hypothetical protein U9M48_001879 [Paspalum notatum var. saurae]|uniref:F-box domain-containing protein n=1 Tax=Paspalum notatum var. saurae TaxID=547442 RepID=A0AAQ3SJC3_PASNO